VSHGIIGKKSQILRENERRSGLLEFDYQTEESTEYLIGHKDDLEVI